MLKQLDWQMVTFVVGSIILEYGTYLHVPKVYFWDVKITNKNDKVA